MPYANISKPANPDLRWEKVNQVNIAVDFGIRNKRVTGSLEIYSKKATDIIYATEMDPTTGIINTSSNSGSLSGKGFDIRLTTVNTDRAIKWSTTLLFSHATNKVLDYKLIESPTRASIVTGDTYGTLIRKGQQVYSLYSLPFAGLDPLPETRNTLSRCSTSASAP